MRTDLRWVLVLGLLAAGCAGPQAHVAITGKSLALDVAFGKPSSDVIKEPNPPLAPVPGGIGVLPTRDGGETRVVVRVVTDRPPRAVDLPPAPTAGCGGVHGTGIPVAVASDSVVGKAPNGAFPYRFSGRTVEGRTVRDVSGIATHTVTSAAVGGGVYRYDVAVKMLGATTSYRYLVTPPFSAVQSVQGGIQLAQVTGDGGYGYTASFRPDKPIQVFTQPAFRGATWHDAATDATSGTAATIDGTVEGKETVDACGVTLDAWRTTTVLTIKSANEDIKATVSTWWATQFGGLAIAERQTYSGTAGSKTVRGTLTSVINVDPGAKAKS